MTSCRERKRSIERAIKPLQRTVQDTKISSARTIFTKTQKPGPFALEMVRPDSPYFSTLLALAVGKIPELPDFSEDSQLGVFTDFGGEHDGAEFATYSVLIVSLNKIGPFQRVVESLRRKHGILKPYSEFAYKKLANGARRRALGDFLKIVDSFLHGLLVTVATDKEMKTLFGNSKHRAHAGMTAQLASLGGDQDGVGDAVVALQPVRMRCRQ